MKITISKDWTATQSHLVAPSLFGVKGGVRPQAFQTAGFDATFMGSQCWSPPIT